MKTAAREVGDPLFFPGPLSSDLRLSKSRKDFQLPIFKHLQSHGHIIFPNLLIIELTGQHLTEVDFSHQSSLIHSSKPLDPSHGGLIEEEHRRNLLFDSTILCHDFYVG